MAPVRSFAMRCRACAGLNVAGRGLRIRLLHLQQVLRSDEFAYRDDRIALDQLRLPNEDEVTSERCNPL